MRPTAPRLLAITPPSGPIEPAVVDRWLEAGLHARGLAVLLRDLPRPTDLEDPVHRADRSDRLRPLAEQLRAAGIPALLSVDASAIGETAVGELAGVQLRGDPDRATLERARAWIGPGRTLGRSCHGDPPADERERVELSDYACVAPVFAPHTHQRDREKRAIGLDALRRWAAVSPGPVVALGGMTPARARDCRRSGAFGIAGIHLFFSTTVAQLAELAELAELVGD